mgnify:FL=1
MIDIERAYQDTKAKDLKETQTILSSLEEGIILIKNEKITFQNEVFDQMITLHNYGNPN